jgi:hypothetical protein
VQTTVNFGDMGELTSFELDSFTTDHFGNTKTQMSGLTTTTFNWDFESRLIGIDYPNSANDDSHEYDGNGLRMRSKLGGAADWTNFVWDEVGGDLIAEYTFVSGAYTLRSLNVWGQGLLWTDRQGTKRYYHFDGEGSTRALTDSSQNVTETYKYTSFGELIAATGAAINPFRWMGQTGAYDDLARGCLFPLTLMQAAHWNAETATRLNGLELETRSALLTCSDSVQAYSAILGRPLQSGLDTHIDGEVGVIRRTFCVRDYKCPVDVPSWFVRWIRRYKHLYCRACEADCIRKKRQLVPTKARVCTFGCTKIRGLVGAFLYSFARARLSG